MSEVICVEKDRIDFLLYAYFGGEKKPYLLASKRAYRDLCRTLRFRGESGDKYRKVIDELIEDRIHSFITKGCTGQEQYDRMHESLCEDIVGYYRTSGVEFYIGHAQKWVNMTMKYLYILGGMDLSGVFNYLHIPLDKYVFSVVQDKLSIPRPCVTWSKINDYALYFEYQQKIRNCLAIPPIRWECSNWLDEASKQNELGD